MAGILFLPVRRLQTSPASISPKLDSSRPPSASQVREGVFVLRIPLSTFLAVLYAWRDVLNFRK